MFEAMRVLKVTREASGGSILGKQDSKSISADGEYRLICTHSLDVIKERFSTIEQLFITLNERLDST